MTNFCEQGGLWVLSLLMMALLPPKRYRGECHPVMFIFGLILVSAGIDIGLTRAVALGRNITSFSKPSEETLFVKHGIF
jgi:hypothetical protein